MWYESDERDMDGPEKSGGRNIRVVIYNIKSVFVQDKILFFSDQSTIGNNRNTKNLSLPVIACHSLILLSHTMTDVVPPLPNMSGSKPQRSSGRVLTSAEASFIPNCVRDAIIQTGKH